MSQPANTPKLSFQTALETKNSQLSLVWNLIYELNTQNLRYCHWKSNLSLAESLMGQTDIDLLVDRKDASGFRKILNDLHFQPAVSLDGESYPAVEHYYGLDDESGVLVHVHAYYRVITGESLAKNYHLPIEEMILQNTRVEDSVRIPTKGAELIVFTLRMMLKHTSLAELLLLSRYWKQVEREIKWLTPEDAIHESLHLIDTWLPSLGTDLFSTCVEALESSDHPIGRIRLGIRLRSRLKMYARHSPFQAWLNGYRKFARMLFRRLAKSPKGTILQSGGAVIAFVGSEATGKSTLLNEIGGWLGQHLAVEQLHVGKPKSSILSFLPNLFVPIMRTLLPNSRSSRFVTQDGSKDQSENSKKVYPLIFAIRSVLLAYDRRAVLRRAFRKAANGSIVLCDRYPSSRAGTPDSAQLSHLPIRRDRYPIRHLLARIEKKLYRDIPPPDMVIFLKVPLEVAVMRNEARNKTEPEEYIRLRHAISHSLEFENTTVYEINTDQAFYQTALQVKEVIWNNM